MEHQHIETARRMPGPARCEQWDGYFRVCWLLIAITALGTTGCRNRRSSTPPSPSARTSVAGVATTASVEQILLEGSFERVSRAASGTARIVRRGNVYELRLSSVNVAQEGTVRVYLVGHERPASTRILDETELKYDIAELERGAMEQRIELPSEPDPALRSVVLLHPAFGVNLAVAPLRSPTNGP